MFGMLEPPCILRESSPSPGFRKQIKYIQVVQGVWNAIADGEHFMKVWNHAEMV